MPQFDISTYSSQIFWLLLIFSIIYSFISRFVVPKAEAIIVKRGEFFDDYQQSIAKLTAHIEELKHQHELGLKEARDLAIKINADYELKLNAILKHKQEEFKDDCQKQGVIVEKQLQDMVGEFRQNKKNLRHELSLTVLKKIFEKTPINDDTLESCNQTMN